MFYVDKIQGQRFGKLVVIGMKVVNKRREAVCKCDCGTEKVISARMLKRGDTTSCGCYHRQVVSEMRQQDLIGKRFSKLVVIGKGEGTVLGANSILNYTWICKCDCGSTRELTTNALSSGNTKSCGCTGVEKNVTRIKSKAGLYAKVRHMRGKAEDRGIKWSLLEEQALETIVGNCEYCGTPPQRVHTTGQRYHGIDRVDSSLPYEIGNVVPCCKNCNFAKNDMSLNEFRDHIARMYNHMNKDK